MKNRKDKTLDGDTGRWKDGEETSSDSISEMPELHLVIKISGSTIAILFLIVFFASMAGYGITVAILSIAVFILSVYFVSIFSFVNPRTGIVREELRRLFDKNPLRVPRVLDGVISPQQIRDEISTEQVISDYEIAIKKGASISNVQSQLLHMELRDEINCKQIGNRLVCWESSEINEKDS